MSEMVVLHEIAVLLLVVLAGFAARRLGALDDGTVRKLSRLVVDVAFPALVFTSLLTSTDAGQLRREWYVPLLGAATIALAQITGLALARASRSSSTAAFLIGLPNWIFLPLPIAKAVYGDPGVRDVLLFNVGAMPVLWLMGPLVLRGDVAGAWKDVLFNPGLLASVAALVGVVWSPGLPNVSGAAEAWSAVLGALAMIGTTTIPLSLVCTGGQIGGAKLEVPSLALVGVTVGRLLVVPAITVAIGALLARAGVGPGHDLRTLLYLIAAMPVAISASPFAERFGGDAHLSAQAVWWTTIASVLTVPLVMGAIDRYGL